MKQHQEQVKYTCCTGTQCGGTCIVKVRVRDGVIVGCEPDDTIHPGIARDDAYVPEQVINKGMIQIRPCAKGYGKLMMVYDPKRVKYPMKRIGERGEAKFARISWDEAIETIAEKLVQTKEKHGPLSILHEPYTGLDQCSFPLAPWFGAGFKAWGMHSGNGWSEPQTWVLGMRTADPSLYQSSIQVMNSKLIVLWGLNPVTSMCGEWGYTLVRAKEKGIPIICIEGRLSPSVQALADQWIPIRPTTDVAMMIAMANVWFKEDLCDKEFIARWVEPEGLQRWKAYVTGAEGSADKTPEWAETICGVPAETIREFARLYARSKPVNLNVALSIGRQFYGENQSRASIYLQALTGNVMIPGGTPAGGTGFSRAYPVGQKPNVDWQRKPGTYNPPMVMAGYKWTKAMALAEKLEKGEISKEQYNNQIGGEAGQPVPNIKMVIFEGNNHLNNLPDINATIKGIKKLDSVIAFTQYTDTPTARYADIILPQIYTWVEGRNCHGLSGEPDLFRFGKGSGNYFVYCQKCIEPVGEVKPHDWVWTKIAKKLGIAEQYNPRMANVPDDKWDETIEKLHREAYEKWAAGDTIAPLKPPGWEEFQKKPVFRYEIKKPHYPFQEKLEKGENPFKANSSGKIEFFSQMIAKGPEYLATHSFPEGSGRSYGGGALPPMAKWVSGGPDTFQSPDIDKYPLLMSTPHSYYREHSFLDNNQWLKDDVYRHAVWISIPDAKKRGIKDNQSVRVFNGLGELVLPAFVTSRVVPGTICVFHGGWYMPGKEKSKLMPDGVDRRGAPNFLIHNEDLPLTIVDFFPCKATVQVEKWEATVK